MRPEFAKVDEYPWNQSPRLSCSEKFRQIAQYEIALGTRRQPPFSIVKCPLSIWCLQEIPYYETKSQRDGG